MEESILNSIKKMLGIANEYTVFDSDIIMHINSVLMILSQLGVGSSKGYSIEDASNSWDEFVNPDDNLNAIKSYIYLKVRLMFDPPINSAVLESMKETIKELEWRLNVGSETIE